MGHGIAQLFALSDFQVTLYDVSLEILEKVIPRIQDNLQTSIKHGILSTDEVKEIPDRITITTDLDTAASQADYIIEAVVEDLEVKLILLSELDETCSAHAILTSTTSSYCVRDMAVAFTHPERFLVTHFWNPPYLIPVVEVMPGDVTSPEVVETTYRKGHPHRQYIKAKHVRNEVLDCRVYALAGLDLLKANLDRCVDRLIARSKRTPPPKQAPA